MIIHNGAQLSFLKMYESLRDANDGTTKALVEIVSPRKVLVHFVSTDTVGKLVGGDSLVPGSLVEFSPSSEFKGGYAASKWVSELLLVKVGREAGLPLVIHRPSSITGDATGEADVVANVVRYANLLSWCRSRRGGVGSWI